MNFEHIQHVLLLRTSLEVRMDHSFSMYAKFPKRIKMFAFWKIWRTYQMNDPIPKIFLCKSKFAILNFA